MIVRDKLPARWHYILWITLLFRLLLPPLPEGVNIVQKILPQIKQTSTFTMSLPTHQESTYKLNSVKLFFPERNVSNQVKEPKTKSVSSIQIALNVWIIGVIFMAILTVVSNVRMLLYIKRQPLITDSAINLLFENCKKKMSIKLNIPLVVSGKLASPTVLGVIRPRILLSQNQIEMLSEHQLQFIFYHELAHIKRKDVLVNCLMNGVLFLHWFNPILWYAYIRMR